MISSIPTYSCTLKSHHNCPKSLYPISSKSLNLLPLVQQLFSKTQQSTRTLFGLPIYQHTNNNQQILHLANLTLAQQVYLCGCYLAINWERVSPSQLNLYLGSLPNMETQVEAIRTEGKYIKLQKNDKMIKINTDDHSYVFDQNSFELDSFDRRGKGQMLSYTLSITKMTINGVGYTFDGVIDRVESSESFVAVKTYTSVNIIFLKNNNGMYQRFDIVNCQDMKWGSKCLYCLMDNETIVTLQMDTINVKSYGKFYPLAKLSIPQNQVTKRYNFKSIAEINKTLVAFGFCKDPNEKDRGILIVVRSPQYGMVDSDYILCSLQDMKSGNHDYSNLIVRNGELCLVLVQQDYQEKQRKMNDTWTSEMDEPEKEQKDENRRVNYMRLHQYYFGALNQKDN